MLKCLQAWTCKFTNLDYACHIERSVGQNWPESNPLKLHRHEATWWVRRWPWHTISWNNSNLLCKFATQLFNLIQKFNSTPDSRQLCRLQQKDRSVQEALWTNLVSMPIGKHISGYRVQFPAEYCESER